MGFLAGKRIFTTGLLSNRSILRIAKAMYREGAEPRLHLPERTFPGVSPKWLLNSAAARYACGCRTTNRSRVLP